MREDKESKRGGGDESLRLEDDAKREGRGRGDEHAEGKMKKAREMIGQEEKIKKAREEEGTRVYHWEMMLRGRGDDGEMKMLGSR